MVEALRGRADQTPAVPASGSGSYCRRAALAKTGKTSVKDERSSTDTLNGDDEWHGLSKGRTDEMLKSVCRKPAQGGIGIGQCLS
jgi:hypothetical protein